MHVSDRIVLKLAFPRLHLEYIVDHVLDVFESSCVSSQCAIYFQDGLSIACRIAQNWSSTILGYKK